MLTSSFPAPITTAFFGERVSLSPRHVRFCSTVSFTTASTEARSTWTKQRPRSHGTASPATLYEILGIRVAASGEEIKAAYRRLARVWHPDVAPVDRKESSANEFMKIHAAYCTLSDPVKRAGYNRTLLQRQRPLTISSSEYNGYSGRNWETDQCW